MPEVIPSILNPGLQSYMIITIHTLSSSSTCHLNYY